MKQVKKRIFAGTVCEQIVYSVPDRVGDIKRYQPKPRFRDEDERQRHKLGISKRKHARAFNANFSPTSLYSTLTFSDDWELHDFPSAKRVRNNFVRTLKRAYPEAVIFLYMGRGKSTHRIHFHMVSEGIPKEVISTKWKYGTIKRIDNLRENNYYEGINHGQDYTGLANYLFDHWEPEIGSHHWMQTKNARSPETEAPTEVHIRGGYHENRCPVAPKGYTLVETKATKYGTYYYKYVIVQKKRPYTRRKPKTDPPGRFD